jgi:acyl-CoA hydrolase
MSEGQAILVKWMSVTDANNDGHIHGGTVMKLCDEAAGLAGIRHARQRVVTAAVDRVTFLHPVFVGDVLTLSASVNAAWRTSMEVGVRVEAENPFTGETRHTSSAYLTMVAIDEQSVPCPSRRSRQSHRVSCAANARRSCDVSTVWPSASRSPPDGSTRNGPLPGGSAARSDGGERPRRGAPAPARPPSRCGSSGRSRG